VSSTFDKGGKYTYAVYKSIYDVYSINRMYINMCVYMYITGSPVDKTKNGVLG